MRPSSTHAYRKEKPSTVNCPVRGRRGTPSLSYPRGASRLPLSKTEAPDSTDTLGVGSVASPSWHGCRLGTWYDCRLRGAQKREGGVPARGYSPGRLGMGRPSKEGCPLRWRPPRSVLHAQPARVSIRPPLPSVCSPPRGAGDPKLASGLKLSSHRPCPLRPRVTQRSSRPPPSVSVWGL